MRHVFDDGHGGVVIIEASWIPGIRLERALANNADAVLVAELQADYDAACVEEEANDRTNRTSEASIG